MVIKHCFMVTHCLIYIFTNMRTSKYNQPTMKFYSSLQDVFVWGARWWTLMRNAMLSGVASISGKKIEMNIENASPSLMDFGEIA